MAFFSFPVPCRTLPSPAPASVLMPLWRCPAGNFHLGKPAVLAVALGARAVLRTPPPVRRSDRANPRETLPRLPPSRAGPASPTEAKTEKGHAIRHRGLTPGA